MLQNNSLIQWLCTKNSKFQPLLTFCTAFFLIALPFAVADTTAENSAEVEPKKSPIKIGGAMRANYVYGTYEDRTRYDSSGQPYLEDDGRGANFGDVDLELLRLNVNLDFHNVIGKLEYRWYPRYFGNSIGYSMIHTAWLGYDFKDTGTLKAGIVRVPFGPTDYGVSNSWFFDQHFYVGLADDPDLGIVWNNNTSNLTYDVGYFLMSEPQTLGNSLNSARYGYDVVKWEEQADKDGNVQWGVEENGFDELHQFNLRAIYSIENVADIGVSAQFGLLQGTNVGDDESGNHFALSAHMKNSAADFTLYSQFTYYAHNITEDTAWGTGDLIPMGAYEFAWPVASEGLIPALSLRYGGINTESISWLNSVMPYIEWSTILKTVDTYNPSTLVTLGINWNIFDSLYVYSDLGLSNGNSFVGNSAGDGIREGYGNIYDGAGDVGANGNNVWNWRLNFNFGVYF